MPACLPACGQLPACLAVRIHSFTIGQTENIQFRWSGFCLFVFVVFFLSTFLHYLHVHGIMLFLWKVQVNAHTQENKTCGFFWLLCLLTWAQTIGCHCGPLDLRCYFVSVKIVDFPPVFVCLTRSSSVCLLSICQQVFQGMDCFISLILLIIITIIIMIIIF